MINWEWKRMQSDGEQQRTGIITPFLIVFVEFIVCKSQDWKLLNISQLLFLFPFRTISRISVQKKTRSDKYFPISNSERYWPQFSHFLHYLSISTSSTITWHPTEKFGERWINFESIVSRTTQKQNAVKMRPYHITAGINYSRCITIALMCSVVVWVWKKTNNNTTTKMTNNKRQNDVNDNANNHLKLLYLRLWTMCQKDRESDCVRARRIERERERNKKMKKREEARIRRDVRARNGPRHKWRRPNNTK